MARNKYICNGFEKSCEKLCHAGTNKPHICNQQGNIWRCTRMMKNVTCIPYIEVDNEINNLFDSLLDEI